LRRQNSAEQQQAYDLSRKTPQTRHSRSPATFAVEFGGGFLDEKSTVRIRLTLAASGWVAFRARTTGYRGQARRVQVTIVSVKGE
jgi:hypothetical protein